MIGQIATIGFILGIIGLFLLDRDSNARTSKALWIPVVWLLIAGSRNVGEWVLTLQAGSTVGMSRGDSYLEGSPIDEVVLGSLLGVGIAVLCARHRQVTRLILKNPPVFLYLLYCASSAVWSDYPDVTLRRWVRSLGDFVMIMVVLSDPNPIAALKRLFARTGFVLVPLSLLFIRYYPELGRSYGADGTPYWSGVTGGKNSLGMICLIIGLGSLWRVLDSYQNKGAPHRTRRLVAHVTLLGMALWLINAAHSATSEACMILAGGAMLLTSRTTVARRPMYVHLLVTGIITVALFALFFDNSGELVGALGRNATLTGRTDVWKRALGIAKNPIFGTGFETFWLGSRLAWMRMLDRDLNHAHNGYLEVYLNLGFVGVGLIAASLARGYQNLVASLRRDPSLNSLKLAYFLVAVIYNCTESAFKMMSPVWLITLIAVMVVPKYAGLTARRVVSVREDSAELWESETPFPRGVV